MFQTKSARPKVAPVLWILAIAAFAVVAASGIAYSAASPSAKLAKQDRLWGGGHTPANACSVNVPSICVPFARDVAVDAHAEGDGSGAVGNSAYSAQSSRTVTCLQVQGNKAVIGGVVTVAGGVGNPGDVYVEYFVDRGTTDPASSQHDLISLIYTGPLADTEFGWPAGFPYACPPVTGTNSLPPVYLEMDGGDIAVQDAPSS